MREATSPRRWTRAGERAAQLAFAPLAWAAWQAIAVYVLDRPHWTASAAPVGLECAMACAWVALLWGIACVWRSLQWPAVVAIVGSLAGPWFHQAIFAWLDRPLVVATLRADGWTATPWESILPDAARLLTGSRDAVVVELLLGACLAALVGLASKLNFVRYSALAALLLFAGHACVTASMRASSRYGVEAWTRGFEQVERVEVSQIPGRSEGCRELPWRLDETHEDSPWLVHYTESDSTRADEVTFGRYEPYTTNDVASRSRLLCDRDDQLVLRRAASPRTTFAMCERNGVVQGAVVATRDPSFSLRRINGLRRFALPTAWITQAKVALCVALALLFVERCVRRALASKASSGAQDPRSEHPYREGVNEPHAREPAPRVERVERAEALDQWAIVAMALHVVAPVIIAVLAERNVPQW